jgi:hypothetical protein
MRHLGRSEGHVGLTSGGLRILLASDLPYVQSLNPTSNEVLRPIARLGTAGTWRPRASQESSCCGKDQSIVLPCVP